MTDRRPGRFAFHSSFVFQPSFRLLCLVALCALLAVAWRTQHASATMTVADNPTPVVTVSAASYETSAIAPEGIVAAFGTQLATATVSGGDTDPNTPGIQLPTSLGGTSVEVGGRLAGLFFVRPCRSITSCLQPHPQARRPSSCGQVTGRFRRAPCRSAW